MIPTDPAILDALRTARVAARDHMAKRDAAGASWHEETVTDLVLDSAFPVVKFADFSRNQEGRVGADWLWWWVDRSGEAFGMLVQAKRLHRLSNKWDVDFDYKNGQQRRALVQTGLDLRVAPMYALYLGTSAWRSGAFCQDPPHKADCHACDASTVSIVPAVVTDLVVEHDVQVSLALEVALPVEFVADPVVVANNIWDSNLSSVEPDLLAFLQQPQQGARRVAQLVFERVTRIRSMGFSGPSEVALSRGTGPIFAEVPDDTGHFSRATIRKSSMVFGGKHPIMYSTCWRTSKCRKLCEPALRASRCSAVKASRTGI